jgi:hypothetical protein
MQDSESEFVSLTSVLEPWFEKDRSELPGDLDEAWRGSRQAAGMKFLLSLWDGLPPVQRRRMAVQFDASDNPANEQAGVEVLDLVACQAKVESEIRRWELVSTPTAVDMKAQEDALAGRKLKLAVIGARLSELAIDDRAAAGEAGGSPVKPTPTDAAVRQWFRDRVAGWPDDKAAPSEDEDWHAAAAHFALGLTRDEIRLVREAETPEAWRKKGRRRPWGIANQKLSPP